MSTRSLQDFFREGDRGVPDILLEDEKTSNGTSDGVSFTPSGATNIVSLEVIAGLGQKSFLLFIVASCFLFEAWVVKKGYGYYASFLSTLGALAFSTIVESSYLYCQFRLSERKTLSWGQFFKYSILTLFLLTLSCFSLAYNSFQSDRNLIKYKESLSSASTSTESLIGVTKRQISRAEDRLKTLLEQERVMTEYDRVTQSSRVVGPEIERVNKVIETKTKKLQKLQNKHGSSLEREASIPPLKAFSVLASNTRQFIVAVVLLQIVVSILLPEIFKATREEFFREATKSE